MAYWQNALFIFMQDRRDKTAFERNGLPVENLGGFVQDSIGWNDRIRRHRLFAHKKVRLCRFEVNNLTFIIWGSDCLTSSATSASSVFLVMTMIIAATTFMITIYATSAFFILATTSAFRAVRIAFYTCGRYSPRNNILFSLFPFLFLSFCANRVTQQAEKRAQVNTNFFINYNV